MRSKLVVALLSSGLLLAACQNTGNPSGGIGLNKTTGGTLIGAGLGGLAGAQVGGGKGQLAAVAVGTLLGGFLGHEIGASLDRADQLAAERAAQQSFNAPIGQTVAWNNPDSGHYGQVTTTRDGTDTRTGAYCREYQTTVTVGGKAESAYGTACRQPDGSWKVQG